LLIFWPVTPCGLVGYIPAFCRKPWRWMQRVLPKHWYLRTNSHCVTTQRIKSAVGEALVNYYETWLW
jgi:hypothetical protein